MAEVWFFSLPAGQLRTGTLEEPVRGPVVVLLAVQLHLAEQAAKEVEEDADVTGAVFCGQVSPPINAVGGLRWDAPPVAHKNIYVCAHDLLVGQRSSGPARLRSHVIFQSGDTVDRCIAAVPSELPAPVSPPDAQSESRVARTLLMGSASLEVRPSLEPRPFSKTKTAQTTGTRESAHDHRDRDRELQGHWGEDPHRAAL